LALPGAPRQQSARALAGYILVAAARSIVHTPGMTLKNAAMLALVGTVLVTAILVFDLIRNVLSIAQGLIPAVTLFSSLIYAFGALSVALFFFVFHKTQS
jgi:hypothetical protein